MKRLELLTDAELELYLKRELDHHKKIKGGEKRARMRAGRPKYELSEHRFYPEWMPDTPKGKSVPILGLWHVQRLLKFYLGYASIEGTRSDEYLTWSPDKIALAHAAIAEIDKRIEKFKQCLKQGEFYA
jgi:hypothetical protein